MQPQPDRHPRLSAHISCAPPISLLHGVRLDTHLSGAARRIGHGMVLETWLPLMGISLAAAVIFAVLVYFCRGRERRLLRDRTLQIIFAPLLRRAPFRAG